MRREGARFVQTAGVIGGRALRPEDVRPSPSATEVRTASGVFTVGVSRSRIHAFGSNGWDAVLWLGSWMSRLIHRDSGWVVTVREGRPELMSGTQPLVSTESFDTLRAAQLRAVELIEEMRTVP
jgi:hypothetical protein